MKQYIFLLLSFVCYSLATPYAIQKYFYSELCRGDNPITYAFNTQGCAFAFDTIYYEYYSCNDDQVIHYYCSDSDCSTSCQPQTTYDIGSCYDIGGASFQFTCEEYITPSFDWLATATYFKNVSCMGEADVVKFEEINRCVLDDSYVQVICQDGVPVSQVCSDNDCENCQDTVLGPYCEGLTGQEWQYHSCGEGSNAASLSFFHMGILVVILLAVLVL